MALLRAALTGGIATGKTYVRTRLATHGIPTLDADTLAREAVAPGSAGLAAVVARRSGVCLRATSASHPHRWGATIRATAGNAIRTPISTAERPTQSR